MSEEDDCEQRTNILGAAFAHLNAPAPGIGQSDEWRKREAARRSGRRRKDWWTESSGPAAHARDLHIDEASDLPDL